jgi:hypothetical protein
MCIVRLSISHCTLMYCVAYIAVVVELHENSVQPHPSLTLTSSDFRLSSTSTLNDALESVRQLQEVSTEAMLAS